MKGLAKSTVKSYQSGITMYKSFCMRLRRPSLLVSEDTSSVFVASLAKEGVSHTSLKVYLAAIRHYQIQMGREIPVSSLGWCALNMS